MIVVESVEIQMMIMLRKLFVKLASHHRESSKIGIAMESWKWFMKTDASRMVTTQ